MRLLYQTSQHGRGKFKKYRVELNHYYVYIAIWYRKMEFEKFKHNKRKQADQQISMRAASVTDLGRQVEIYLIRNLVYYAVIDC